MSTTSFSELSPASSPAALALVVVSCLVSSIATLLFLIVLHRAGPVKAIILRSLEVILILIIQIAFTEEKGIVLSDIAGVVLVFIAVSHVIIEMMFY